MTEQAILTRLDATNERTTDDRRHHGKSAAQTTRRQAEDANLTLSGPLIDHKSRFLVFILLKQRSKRASRCPNGSALARSPLPWPSSSLDRRRRNMSHTHKLSESFPCILDSFRDATLSYAPEIALDHLVQHPRHSAWNNLSYRSYSPTHE